MKVFAIGVGGSGAKCLEATIHLHTLGLLDPPKGAPIDLGVLFVEPDRQSALLHRCQQALARANDLRHGLNGVDCEFCRGSLTDYGVWNPVETMKSQGALTMAQIYTKKTLEHRNPALGGLLDCLFTQDEQNFHLKEGFRGRPPIGSALMSSTELCEHTKTWGRLLDDVKQVAKSGERVCIHLFGSVFGGTGSSGVPTLGRLLQKWLEDEKIKETVSLTTSLLLPYFNFNGQATEETGIHAEASNFQLNTAAALQNFSQNRSQDFSGVYLIGSSEKVSYDFSIGGVSQGNAAHLVEVLAALGLRHAINNEPSADGEDIAAYTLSREEEGSLEWSDLPDHEVIQKELCRGAKLAAVWRNNISLDLQKAKGQPLRRFYVGAPWATRFYKTSDPKRTLGSREDTAIRVAVDQWAEALLTWLAQVCSSTGHYLNQKLLSPDKLQVESGQYLASFHGLTLGNAAVPDSREQDVERLKIRLDQRSPYTQGTPGLVATLWKLCDQQ